MIPTEESHDVPPATHPWRRLVGASIALGAIMVAAFPPLDLWWTIFLAPTAVAIAATTTLRFRWIATILFLPAFAAWLHHQWWVGAVSGAGLVPLVAYLAAWTPLLAWMIRRIHGHPSLGRLPMAVLLPVLWTGTEYVRATIALEGYPWYLLGQPLVEWLPLAQPAAIGGITLLAVLPAAIGGLVADVLMRRPRTGRIGLGVGVLAAGWLAFGLATVTPPGSGRPGPVVLAIQTNLPQSNKVAWTPTQQWEDAVGFARDTVAAFEEASRTHDRIDLVAWPETMLPGVGLEPATTNAFEQAGWWPGNRFVDLATELQQMLGVPLLLGSSAMDGVAFEGQGAEAAIEWDRRFNSVYLLDEDGPASAARYDKVVLTPFGERMPYISEWPWLEQRLLDLGARGMSFDLASGETPRRLALDDEVSIGTPICFEDTVPEACRRLVWSEGVKAGSLLINASNDGWFGSSPGPRAAHLQLARVRAIENRVPMVRAVNTGITAWIDSCGRIRAASKPLEAGWLVAETELDDRRPIFAMIGQAPAGLLAIATAGLVGCTLLPRRRTPDPVS